VESAGLTSGTSATAKEGSLAFDYGGANTILLWFEDSSSTVDAVIADSYISLKSAQPDYTFSLINEGNRTVDSNTAKYLTFVTTAKSGGSSSGGIAGAWKCPSSSTMFSLTVTSSDAAVVQIRFKRLLDVFTCN
jgi:hypothetical protein